MQIHSSNTRLRIFLQSMVLLPECHTANQHKSQKIRPCARIHHAQTAHDQNQPLYNGQPSKQKTVKRRRNPEDTEQRGDADLHNLQCIRVDEYHRRVKCQNIRHDKSGNRQPRRIERRFHRRRFRDRGTRISCQCHRRCDIHEGRIVH